MGSGLSVQSNLRLTLIPNKHDAQRFLDIAEKEDSYLEECHDDKANSLSRRNLTYTANQISLRDNNYATSYLDGISTSLPAKLLNELN